eukprot:scaffold434_cov186-Pinguiococcus_pyrenoidosus.AAC.8
MLTSGRTMLGSTTLSTCEPNTQLKRRETASAKDFRRSDGCKHRGTYHDTHHHQQGDCDHFGNQNCDHPVLRRLRR